MIVTNELYQIPPTPTPETTKPSWGRFPSHGDTPRDVTSTHSQPLLPQQFAMDSAASPPDSWRTNAAPLHSPPSTTFTKRRLHTADDLDSLSIKEGEVVETFDFSDLGKLIGAPGMTEEEQKPLPPDPVAAPSTDLVDARNREPPIASKSDGSAWRRKQEESHPEPVPEDSKSDTVELTINTDEPSARSLLDQSHPPFPPPQRSPRTNTFREASMNSLDDTLSRIKGALDHIYEPPLPEKKSITTESQQTRSQPPTPVPPPQTLRQEPPKPSRWLPPALRPKDHVPNPLGLDAEEYVTKQPLPEPPFEVATVLVPKFGVARGPLTRRQFGLAKCPSNGVRWDILTWDPPVEGMSKRDFSLNEILFRKPTNFKGKFRPLVKLPRSGNSRFRGKAGAFGRPRGGDDAQTWRRSEPLQEVTEVPEPFNTLDTVSVSPPPVPQDEIKALSPPATASPQLRVGASEAIGRQKAQRKPLVVENVAFYRTRTDIPSTESATAVSFTVSSELDDGFRPEVSGEATPSVSTLIESSATRGLDVTVDPPVPIPSQSQTNSKGLDGSVRN